MLALIGFGRNSKIGVMCGVLMFPADCSKRTGYIFDCNAQILQLNLCVLNWVSVCQCIASNIFADASFCSGMSSPIFFHLCVAAVTSSHSVEVTTRSLQALFCLPLWHLAAFWDFRKKNA